MQERIGMTVISWTTMPDLLAPNPNQTLSNAKPDDLMKPIIVLGQIVGPAPYQNFGQDCSKENRMYDSEFFSCHGTKPFLIIVYDYK